MANQGYDHEFDRIKQFEREAGGNRDTFEKKILLRSMWSSDEKRERFAHALKILGEKELAQRVLMAGTMKQMSE